MSKIPTTQQRDGDAMRLLLLTSSIVGVGLRSVLQQRWPESQILLSLASEPKQLMPQALRWQPDVTIIDADHLAVMPLFEQLGSQGV